MRCSSGAQMGKTETFLDIIGERLDNRPAPIIYAGPSKEFVTDQFEPRLVELFRQSTSLTRKVLGGIDGKRQKRTLKRVAGVRVRLAHTGSSTALKSDPAAIALVDEYDEMLANVNGQGDPLGLLEARGFTYAGFKAGITSTPSRGLIEIERDNASGLEFWKVADDTDELSPIWKLFQEGTRHHWCWPCPHCDEYFVPRFKQLRWNGATPAAAALDSWIECPHCGLKITEEHKADMNARGRYVAPGQKVDAAGNVTGEPPHSSTLSRWCSGLASPFVTIGKRVEAYLVALKSGEAAKIQTAVNAGFGEVYADDRGDLPQWEEIKSRAEAYKPGMVPLDAIYLTIGVDVQKNRLPYVIRAWGARATSWLIEAGELWGETAHPEVWADLASKITTPIDGMLIKLAFIDSGFRPGKKFAVPVNRVYEFARRFPSFVFATKGASIPLVTPLVRRKIEVEPRGGQAKYGLELIRLDSGYWKSWVHERLAWPSDQAGAFHLHEEITEDYCRQLVAETLVSGPGGKKVWVERARDNHFLDAEALAAAAGFMLNVQHLRLGVRRRAPEDVAGSIASAENDKKPAAKKLVAKKNNRFRDAARNVNN